MSLIKIIYINLQVIIAVLELIYVAVKKKKELIDVNVFFILDLPNFNQAPLKENFNQAIQMSNII